MFQRVSIDEVVIRAETRALRRSLSRPRTAMGVGVATSTGKAHSGTTGLGADPATATASTASPTVAPENGLSGPTKPSPELVTTRARATEPRAAAAYKDQQQPGRVAKRVSGRANTPADH